MCVCACAPFVLRHGCHTNLHTIHVNTFNILFNENVLNGKILLISRISYINIYT